MFTVRRTCIAYRQNISELSPPDFSTGGFSLSARLLKFRPFRPTLNGRLFGAVFHVVGLALILAGCDPRILRQLIGLNRPKIDPIASQRADPSQHLQHKPRG